MLTAERLRSCFIYRPRTGRFVRLTGSHIRAGFKHSSGYVCIQIEGKRYFAHRLAWLYMTGHWPDDEIDHKNRVKDDNRWRNLREATSSQNCANVQRRRDNVSGVKGVHWSASERRWIAQISVNGTQKKLGRFKRRTEAALAYRSAAAKHFGEFANV